MLSSWPIPGWRCWMISGKILTRQAWTITTVLNSFLLLSSLQIAQVYKTKILKTTQNLTKSVKTNLGVKDTQNSFQTILFTPAFLPKSKTRPLLRIILIPVSNSTKCLFTWLSKKVEEILSKAIKFMLFANPTFPYISKGRAFALCLLLYRNQLVGMTSRKIWNHNKKIKKNQKNHFLFKATNQKATTV